MACLLRKKGQADDWNRDVVGFRCEEPFVEDKAWVEDVGDDGPCDIGDSDVPRALRCLESLKKLSTGQGTKLD